MSEQTITCPECGAEIPLTRALTEKLRGEMQASLRQELKTRELAMQKKTKELESERQKLQIKAQEQDQQFAKKLEQEKLKLWEVAQQKAQEKLDNRLKDLEKANLEKSKELEAMQKQELELRRQKRELESKEKSLKLELERQLDAERTKISAEAKKEADEELAKKMQEKDQQMEQMRKTIEDLRRKSEQGSMQVQGDAQEEALKKLLLEAFPFDEISDVPTGVKGADLIQVVKNDLGRESGKLIWESKNTKAFSQAWLKKLKDDQATAKADLAILVTQALPEGVESYDLVEGVWVTSYKYALPLITTLRFHLLEIAKTKSSLVNKGEKMEFLYSYLSGPEFKNRIENIVSAFSGLKNDLETEKRSMQRIWNKREKEIERVIMNTSGLYGDLQGIIGSSLQTIETLELPSGDETLF
jgi:hypothetical protein